MHAAVFMYAHLPLLLAAAEKISWALVLAASSAALAAADFGLLGAFLGCLGFGVVEVEVMARAGAGGEQFKMSSLVILNFNKSSQSLLSSFLSSEIHKSVNTAPYNVMS